MSTNHRISPIEFKKLLHPSEDAYFDLALIVALPVVGIAFLWIFTTVTFVIVLIISLVVSVWFALQILKARLTANALKVTPDSFPEIYKVLQDVCYTLDYHKNVDIYVVDEGKVNAFLMRFFGTKFIILNSGLVEDMIDKKSLLQMKWVIARFVGALRAKHDKLFFLRLVIESLEKIQVFNVFLFPYERAIQYSGDQIGLAVCGDLEQSMVAFQKFMVGNQLSGRVNIKAILAQHREMNIFAILARLFATHPHVIDRYVNLMDFAKKHYPDTYEQFVRQNSQ